MADDFIKIFARQKFRQVSVIWTFPNVVIKGATVIVYASM
jgi:hypothetical protein